MWWILLLVVMAGLLVYLLSLPASSNVVRSIVINKPAPEVYSYIRDFANWNAWSPWMIHEPTAKTETVNGAQIGGMHSWEGSKIGAGNMQHTVHVENERVEMLLTFLRPFKSKADVSFALKDVSKDGQIATEVVWSMTSKMPIYIRPFVPFMEMMIGHDFALGLGFLRGKLDPASEHPKIAFNGIVQLPEQLYVTEHFAGTLEGMRKAMYEAYPRLWQSISAETDRWEQKPTIAAYHKVKPLKQTVVMDMGFAVKSLKPGEKGLTTQQGRYFQLTYNGNYDLLGSVWNAAYGQVKMQKLKVDASRPALEIYQTNPMEVQHSNDWVTLVCIPVK